MQQRKRWLGLGVAVMLTLSACTMVVQPETPGTASSSPTTGAAAGDLPTAIFVLPDGNTCYPAGAGATLAYDGKPLTYTCEHASQDKITGILGDPVQVGETEWQVELATLSRGSSGFDLESSASVEFTAWQIDLASGARCLHAGFGATFGFDEGRANYTCDLIAADAAGPANGGEWVILGQLIPGEAGVWLAQRAEVARSSDGFTLLESAQAPVSMISGLDPNAAAPTDAPAASTLVGPTWQWAQTEYSDGTVVAAVDPSRYTLAFLADGALQVQLDCNRGGGSYTVDGASLTFGPIASTLMGCPADSQDGVFGQDLGRVASYVIEDGMLYLALAVDGGIMTFAPEGMGTGMGEGMGAGMAENADNPLAGTQWQWLKTSYGNDTELVATDPARYTLAFMPDGMLQARLDCNRGRSSYTVDGASLTFGPIASTRMACPPDSQDTEFIRDLTAVVSYVIEEGKLYLALKLDTGIMEFAPVE